MSVFVLLVALQGAGAGTAPLRKSDLVRLLSGSALSQTELAQLVTRNCLTFAPTDRDRTDFRRLGASSAVLTAVDGCARRATARVTSFRPPITPSVTPTLHTDRVSATRSGFVAGGGQRGPAGARLPRALVFEAADSTGVGLPGIEVGFAGINARTEPASATTDGLGQVRLAVTLGEHVGPATIIGSIGVLEKQVAFNVAAGPASQLVLTCGSNSLSERFAMRPDTIVTLRVVAHDAYTNRTGLSGLRAAVADARIFRVLHVTQDSLSGAIALKPDQPGTTSLAVIANGMRQYFTVTVPPRQAPGKVDCA